jgi:hypothetical protein
MSKDSKRRSFFARSSLGTLSGHQNPQDDEPANLLRKRRTASFRTTFSTASTQPGDDESLSGGAVDSPASPRTTFSRGSQSRSSSVFGSLRGLRLHEGSEEPLSASSTRTFSGHWPVVDDSLRNIQVLRHGEVQTSSSMFRKKKEYLVLTESHLMRFKSHQKAADAFVTYVHSVTNLQVLRLTNAEYLRPTLARLHTDIARTPLGVRPTNCSLPPLRRPEIAPWAPHSARS